MTLAGLYCRIVEGAGSVVARKDGSNEWCDCLLRASLVAGAR